MKMKSGSGDYERIEKAILFLERNSHHQPGLKEIAESVNLSEYHFQRLFRRWAGISPKRFLQVLTLERTKDLLKDKGSLLEVTYQSGLSSAGRLHDLFVTIESVTPDEFRKQGKDITIRYGFHPSPFGECLVAITDRGVSNLSFVQEGGRSQAVNTLRKQWKHALVVQDQDMTRKYAARIFTSGGNRCINLALRGTNFQIKVWQALLNIPCGRVSAYETIAAAVGRPDAVRAVANAVAGNPVAFLIPCHRVIRKTGALGGYHWGTVRKKAMLAWEAGRNKS
jgi:AraC family transcriptional regulator of adaptative response/methylated-DNA-[protein]-cysteine methyltransferase